MLKKFEVISVDAYKGSFDVEVHEWSDVESGMKHLLEIDDFDEDFKLEKNTTGGWYMQCEEETFIVREITQ